MCCSSACVANSSYETRGSGRMMSRNKTRRSPRADALKLVAGFVVVALCVAVAVRHGTVAEVCDEKKVEIA